MTADGEHNTQQTMIPPVDSQGRCPSHPFVQMQCQPPRINESKVLLDYCPLCTLDSDSSASSVYNNAAININDDGVENEKVVPSVGDGLVSEKQSSSSSISTSSHVRPQPKRSQSSSALDDEIIKLHQLNSNSSRVRICPSTSSSTSPKFVRPSGSNSLPTLSTCVSISASSSSSPGVVGLLNEDPKYKKVCPNVIMQRQLNESEMTLKMSNMGISDKSDNTSRKDLSSSTPDLPPGEGKDVESGKDERGATTMLDFERPRSNPTFGAWTLEEIEEVKDTRHSPFKECNDEGKGIMLCIPVTEVQQQLQVEPPSHDEQMTNHDEPAGQEEQDARRLRRYQSRERTTSPSSQSSSLDNNDDNNRRPDPEGFPCQDYSSQASTQDRRSGKLSVKQLSRPPPTPQDRQQEPEEDHTQHHQRGRPRRSRNSTARISSFTIVGGSFSNGHYQVPPPPPPPPLKCQQHAITTSPPKRQNSAPDLSSLFTQQSLVATRKSKVGNNRVNMTVNPRQDDDTISTLSCMGKKKSSNITQGQIKDGQILRDPQLQDVKELPLPSMTKTDGTVITSHTSLCEEDMKQPSIGVNINNYDKRGFCVVHPHIQLRKKKFFKQLSLSLQLSCQDPNGIGVVWNGPGSSSDKYNPEEEDGWKILMSVCPECCTEELRRTQLALVAIQQRQLCQSVEMNESMSLVLDSHQSVTEHPQQATTSSDRVLSRLPS